MNDLSKKANIRDKIYNIRNLQVMLDAELAEIYGVDTRVFNQAIKRNIARFPEQFRFQLTEQEYACLRSQFVISNMRGGRRYLPYVFTALFLNPLIEQIEMVTNESCYNDRH